MPPEPNDQVVHDLKNEVQELSLLIKRTEIEREKAALIKPKDSAPKPLWTTLVEVIGVPAAIAGLVLQITNVTGSVSTNEKTKAETEKIRTEEIKSRVEIQAMVEKLATAKDSNSTSYNRDFDAALPELKKAIDRLDQARQSMPMSSQQRAQDSISKFVILWIVYHFVGLVFDILNPIWSSLTTAPMLLLVSKWNPKKKDGSSDYERKQAVIARCQVAIIPVSLVPMILRWSIQLSIFLTLLVPLFNEQTYILGSKATFNEIIKDAREMRLSKALTTVKSILCR